MQQQESMQGQPCPACHQKTLTLTQRQIDVPYFGNVFLFSMQCSSCKYFKSDIEAEKVSDPVRYTFEIKSEEDMKVRVVKSADATIKLPFLTTIEPGASAQGYVTNVEGIINRVKHQIEELKENAEDPADRKKAKNLLKKIFKITTGQETQKLILEDPTGNSAIVSDSAKKDKLKAKKASA